MKNLIKIITFLSMLSISLNPAFCLDKKDYKEAVAASKKMCKLVNQNKIDELKDYYATDYKSFDGYTRDELMDIYKVALELYPDIKSKEKITKVEEENGNIKIYITEKSKIKIDPTYVEAIWESMDKLKGTMQSSSHYAVIFKKENGAWVVASDEIYDETTEIKYGEAIGASFQMDMPDNIKSGEEYTVKTVLKPKKGRFMVGSIGHDKIALPLEKNDSPFRSIEGKGTLERVMIANKEGKNEYVNYSYAFIAPHTFKDKYTESVTYMFVSGMGFVVKRINILKEEAL